MRSKILQELNVMVWYVSIYGGCQRKIYETHVTVNSLLNNKSFTLETRNICLLLDKQATKLNH